jgi:dCMP deaminase
LSGADDDDDRPRTGVYSWDESFMLMALAIAGRSKDPRTQVGAVFVNADHRVMSVGYNGAPRGLPDSDMHWRRHADDPALTKYPYVIHAERNAILNYRGLLSDFLGSTLYVTLFPCHECAKSLAQIGVGRVAWLNGPRHADDAAVAMDLLKWAGTAVDAAAIDIPPASR